MINTEFKLLKSDDSRTYQENRFVHDSSWENNTMSKIWGDLQKHLFTVFYDIYSKSGVRSQDEEETTDQHGKADGSPPHTEDFESRHYALIEKAKKMVG